MYNFYSKLYADDNLDNNVNYKTNLINIFVVHRPKLTEQEKNNCEGLIKTKSVLK